MLCVLVSHWPVGYFIAQTSCISVLASGTKARHDQPMKNQRLAIFAFLGTTAGTVTWFAVNFMTEGLIRTHATVMALIAGIFVLGLIWVKLPAPRDAKAARGAVFTRNSRRMTSLIFLALTTLAAYSAVGQSSRGYPLLKPDQVISQPTPVSDDFYSVVGKPVIQSMYRMRGSEGEHVVVPIDRYEGRILAMLEAEPKPTELKITGKLRTDVRTVQRAQSGAVDGPFLSIYREHMGLPEGTQVYFLDTGLRAGLNVQSIVFVLLPFYFLLLTLSQPIKSTHPAMRIKSVGSRS